MSESAVGATAPPPSRVSSSLTAAFARAAGTARLVRHSRLYRADCDTPLAIFARLSRGESRAFLLESAEGGETWARYSFLGIGGLVEVTGFEDRVEVRRGDTTERLRPGLEAVRALLAELRPEEDALPERFAGGFVGYLAYDAVREFERVPERYPDPGAPRFRFVLPEALCIYDNFRQDLRLLAFASGAGVAPTEAAARGAAEALQARLDVLERRLVAASGDDDLERCLRYPLAEVPAPSSLRSSFARADFLEAVRRCKEYILAGDAFQVVLSQRLRARGVALEPFTIYRRLRRANPSPYLFYIAWPDEVLIGASPEVMVRLTGRRAEVRPIAGTRPRGATPERDAALEQELLADPKERAEHVMLLDLGRNDLGRVSESGSIRIPEQMVIERYSKVMHIVSHVEGQLRPGLDWLDLLAATFPAGTLTGAPKIRAMEIIDELEPSRRRLYGGAIGYIGFDGNMDLCITIRTLHGRGDEFVVQAGAGIVADSVAEHEYEESLNKARALLAAIGVGAVEEVAVETDTTPGAG
jgi:anthranilate synthase component I